MTQSWAPIQEFPEYEVSDLGNIMNSYRGTPVRPSRTRQGACKITLYHNGQKYTRSVGRLVALAHVDNEFDPDIFDTPIHLNGDLMDCRADNLMWRPRWFAVKFHKQYWVDNYHTTKTLLQDVDSGEIYEGVKPICEEFGVLYHDVLASAFRHIHVFPTWQEFRFADSR